MDSVIVVQLVATFGAFGVLIVAGTLPFCLVRCTDKWSSSGGGRSKGTSKLLSLSNCFAAGIFLSTCFLGLLPHVRHHGARLREAVEAAAANHSSDPALAALVHSYETEMLLVLGFLFILLVEQLVLACHGLSCVCAPSKKKCRSEERRVRPFAARRESGGTVEVEFEPLVGSSKYRDAESSSEDEIAIKVQASVEPSEARAEAGPRPPTLSVRSLILLLGLSIHAVFEGLALGVQTTQSGFTQLLFAVMLHEVLCSAAYGLSLAEQRASLGPGFMSVVLLAMTIPLGMCLGLAVPKNDGFTSLLLRYILEGLAGGIFVYVGCVEMLGGELASGHSHSGGGEEGGVSGVAKALSTCLGALLFIVFTLLAPH